MRIEETIEQEIYRLMSMKKTINKDDIEGIGINFRRDNPSPRVTIEFKDGIILMGKDMKNEDHKKLMTIIHSITNEFFEIEE